MRALLLLAPAFLRERPIRLLLASVAAVASVCIVVWVASGYDALLLTFDEFSKKALGRYVLSVAPIGTAEEKAVPPEVVEALRADPAVASVEPMWVRCAPVRPKSPAGGEFPGDEVAGRPGPPASPRRARPGAGPGMDPGFSRMRPGNPGPRSGLGPGLAPGGPGMGPDGRPPESTILGTDSPAAPFDLLDGRWIDPARPEALETAVSAGAARRLGANVGDELLVGKGERACSLRVVGIVDAPAVAVPLGSPSMKILAPAAGDLYVAAALAERLHGRAASASFAGISLKPGADLTRFRFGWAPRLGRFSVPVQFQEAHDIEEALDESAAAENVQLQAYAATGIAMLVALLVVFCTLNMGVSERVRQFAVLRAVALTRAQVGLLIAFEGLLLATIGFLGGLGVGTLLLWHAAKASARILHHGAALGGHSLCLAAVAAYGGALLASIIPAWRATRVRPVDAMAPRPLIAGGRNIPRAAVLIGLVLIAVNPVLTFVVAPAFEARAVVFMAAGFAALAVGVVLTAPAVVALVDRGISPLLARMLGIAPRLLASQVTSHLGRTVGAAVSMTVGLGLYIAVQVWGFTMLEAFVPGRWVPDAVIAFGPGGISPDEAAAVARWPGVDPGRCLPLVVEQPRLLDDITHSAERASVIRQDNVILVGLDLGRALGGDPPLLKFEWVRGSPGEAVRRIEKGRACVVPEHFLRETGLDVGGAFDLVPPESPAHPVRYTVAGSVHLPGWHWQTKHTGFRPRTHRAAALVFADYASVSKDFGLRAATHVWLSYGPGGADPERLAGAARDLYSKALGRPVAAGDAPGDAPYVRVMPVETIRRMTLDAAKRWIWVISQIPLVALLIAGVGVLNVMLASVRARLWDMGVLRAIGFTRWTLVRAVVAEGLLIGAVAALLSLGFGILAGWCGCGFAQSISFFGGLHPTLTVPWLPVARGLLAVLLLSALAAVWPAVSIGRARPLALLQQGRGGF